MEVVRSILYYYQVSTIPATIQMHRLRLLWGSQCTLSYSVCMYPIFLHPTVGVPFICNRAPAAMANNLTRGRVI